jgi:hypothetical protein
VTAGAAGSVTVTVKAEDASGNPSAGYTGTFTLSSSDGKFTPVSGLSLTDGSGTFTETLYTAGPETFTVTDNSVLAAQGYLPLPAATSGSVAVTATTASKVVFTTGGQPSNVAVGADMSPAVVVDVEDLYGNLVKSDSSSTVTLLVTSGTSTSVLTQTTVSAGVATFSSLTINQGGLGDTLTAADGGLTPATSSSFNVTPVTTTTTVSSSNPSVVYGTQVTFTAIVTAQGGSVAPTAGSVDFYDTTTHHDLGAVSIGTSSGLATTFTLMTGIKTLNATTGDTITATYTGTSFVTSSGTVTQTVSPKAITVTAAYASKPYDGTTTTSVTPTVPAGALVGTDALAFSESFASKNAGSETLSVNAGGSVNDGNNGNNYSVQFATTTGSIAQKTITINATIATKTYDGTTSSPAVPTIPAGSLVGGDTASGLVETYAGASAGTETLNVTAYTINDGNNGNNYTVVTVSATAGSITKLAITIAATSAAKIYDGSTSTSSVPTITPGLIGADASIVDSETFASGNEGTGLTLIPATLSLSDPGNYNLTYQDNHNGLIAKRAITVTAASNTKTYDGTTTAGIAPTVTGGSLAPTDTSNADFIETYVTRNAGSNLSLTPSGSVNDNNSGNNYAVTFVAAPTGVINKLAITVTASNDFRPYDGTTKAWDFNGSTPVPVLPTYTGALGAGDTFAYTESFTSKDVSSSVLTLSGSINDGNGGNNYTVTSGTGWSADISPMYITLTTTTYSRTYDGLTDVPASVTPTITLPGYMNTLYGLTTTLPGSDKAAFSEYFSSRNEGTESLLESGSVNDGVGGADYSITKVYATGSISPESIVVQAVSYTKAYDGSTSAAVSPTYTAFGLASNTVMPGDTAAFIETFNTSAEGTGLTLTPSGSVNDSNHGNNYSVSYPVETWGTSVPPGSQPGAIIASQQVSYITVTASPTSIQAGNNFILVVTAHDSTGNTVTNCSDTVDFSSLDLREPVPAQPVTLSNGVGYALATLQTVNSAGWTITATDETETLPTANCTVTVTAAPASQLVFSTPPASTLATGTFPVTIDIEDAYGMETSSPARPT